MNLLQHAQWLITYFENTNHHYPAEKWAVGLQVASKWLELLQADAVNPAEANQFIEIVDKYKCKWEGSGWFDLATGVRVWAIKHGFVLPYTEWPYKVSRKP